MSTRHPASLALELLHDYPDAAGVLLDEPELLGWKSYTGGFDKLESLDLLKVAEAELTDLGTDVRSELRKMVRAKAWEKAWS